MSNVLYIRGDVPSVINKLETVRDILVERELKGYSMFNSEFEWRYKTAGDTRVCPICNSHNGNVYNGEEVKNNFPNTLYLGNYIAHPRTHDNPDFPDAGYYSEGNRFEGAIYRRNGADYGCGCRLRLLHPAESFEHILHKEKAGAIQ